MAPCLGTSVRLQSPEKIRDHFAASCLNLYFISDGILDHPNLTCSHARAKCSVKQAKKECGVTLTGPPSDFQQQLGWGTRLGVIPLQPWVYGCMTWD